MFGKITACRDRVDVDIKNRINQKFKVCKSRFFDCFSSRDMKNIFITIGMTKLADGSVIKGFSCEPFALEGAREISQFGSWRAFRASA